MRISDWSSDVCSSDLPTWNELGLRPTPYALRSAMPAAYNHRHPAVGWSPTPPTASACPTMIDRKSVVEGKSVSVRVDLGGRRIIKKKKTIKESIDNSNESAN